MIQVMKAVAHPWQCDVLGHLTTRFYVAMFDDASYHFLATVCGWQGNEDPGGNLGWADVRHEIDYRAEVTSGALLDIYAGLTHIGGKSITAVYEMRRVGNDGIAARLESTSVLFDLDARRAAPIEGDLRDRLTRHLEAGEA